MVPAYTSSELGELLPWKIEIGDDYYELSISKNGRAEAYNACYDKYEGDKSLGILGNFYESCKNECDVRAKLLIYLLEQGLK